MTMLIRLAYDIQFDVPAPVAMVALLNVHPSRAQDLVEPDELQTEPALDIKYYFDNLGNRCARFVAPRGQLRPYNSTLIRDSGFFLRRTFRHGKSGVLLVFLTLLV